MPIDFSVLQAKQPTGGVVAQLPQQSNPFSTMAGGIAQGMQQGAQQGLINQQMAESQQRMDISKQELPGKLQYQTLTNQTLKTDLEEKQRINRNAQQIETEFNKSWDNGMSQMKKTDPAGYLKLQLDIENTKQTIANTADKIADNKSKSSLYYQQITGSAADLAQHALQAEQQQPGSGEAVYQQGLKLMGPALAASLPPEFTPNNMLLLTKLGMDSHIALAKASEAKNSTNEIKNAQRISELKTAKEKGSATPEQLNELTALQASVAKTAGIDTPLSKAQDVVSERKTQYESAVQKNGVNSKEAREAKINLDQATQAAANEARDKEGIVSGAIHTISSGIGSLFNGSPSSQQSLSSPQQVAPIAPAGRVIIYDKNGKAFHIPASQVKDALATKQYTLKK